MDDKKIGIASDHAGYQLKEFIIGYLDSKGYDVHDFGCHSEESCDYPDYAHPLAEAIEKGELPRGIAMCGSANGITITLNKHQGIRAAIWLGARNRVARAQAQRRERMLHARPLHRPRHGDQDRRHLPLDRVRGRAGHQRRIDKIPVSGCGCGK